MTKRRERLEVIHDILSIIRLNNNSIKLTPLMRKSNLSSQGFAEYHRELLSKRFIKEEQDKKGKRFATLTDKGFKFLEKYQIILGFIEEFEL